RAAGDDGAGDVVAIFRGRGHHGAGGIVDAGRRLPFRPVDGAVSSCVRRSRLRPFVKRHYGIPLKCKWRSGGIAICYVRSLKIKTAIPRIAVRYCSFPEEESDGPRDRRPSPRTSCPSPLNSRYCAQAHAGARAVRRLRITPSGTPGFSFATASARASMMASMSARICLIRSSSGGVSVCFMAFNFLSCACLCFLPLRLMACLQLLPRGRGFILRAPQRLFALRLVACDMDLQIIGQRSEALLAIVRPRARRIDACDIIDG